MKWKHLIGIVLTLVFCYLATRNIDFQLFQDSLARIDVRLWLASVPVLAFGFLVRTVRWKLLLIPMANLPLLRLFPYLMIGAMFNELVPVRAGDFYQTYLLSDRDGLPYLSSLAVQTIVRIMEGFVLVLLFVATLWIADIQSPWLFRLRLVTTIGFGAAVSLILLVVKAPDRMDHMIDSLAVRWPTRISEMIRKRFGEFYDGLRVLNSTSVLLMGLLLTILHWLIEVGFYMAMLHAFGFKVGIAGASLLLVVISLGGLLPAAPGYIGIFEYACVISLSFFGVSESDAFASAVVIHITELAVILSFGIFSLFHLGVNFSQLYKKKD